jgi:hypothetical protein
MWHLLVGGYTKDWYRASRPEKKKACVMLEDGQTIDVTTGL